MSSKNLIDDALLFIYETFGELLMIENYDECKLILESIDLEKIEVELILGILTITLPMFSWAERVKFYDNSKNHLLKTFDLDYTNKLLKGLDSFRIYQ